MPVAKKNLTKPCPACRSEVAVTAKFCNFCGQRITPDVQLEPIEHKQSRERILDELEVFSKEKYISGQTLQQLQSVLQCIQVGPKVEVITAVVSLTNHPNRHVYSAAWQTLLRVLERPAFLDIVREALIDPLAVPVVLTALPLDQQLADLLWPAVQVHPQPWVQAAFFSRASSAQLALPREAKRLALSW